MIDIQALMDALPVSSLEPNHVASIGGIVDVSKDKEWRELIHLLEPPARNQVPYIEPIGALEKLLRRREVDTVTALKQAHKIVTAMKARTNGKLWVRFFDSVEPDSPECIPVSDFMTALRNEELAEPKILDFFDQAALRATMEPIFRGPDNHNEPWSLECLPRVTPPKAMIEFLPAAPWYDYGGDPFLIWRQNIRPVAQALELALGEPVYDFADLDDGADDDNVHRLLVLHWCCTLLPDSTFVKYLIAASGAFDVNELKEALVAPASYVHPFEMNNAFLGLEAQTIRFEYRSRTQSGTIQG